MSKKTIHVWLTKYALSKGKIDEADAQYDPDFKGMITVGDPSRSSSMYFHGKEWHVNHADAVAQVHRMIAAKRRTIAKTLTKLDAMERSLDLSVIRKGL